MSLYSTDPFWKRIRAALEEGPGFFAQDLDYLEPSLTRVEDGVAFYDVSLFIPPDDGQTYFRAVLKAEPGWDSPALVVEESDAVFKEFSENDHKSIEDKLAFIMDRVDGDLEDE